MATASTQVRRRAMGSDAHLLVVGGPEGLVGRLEQRIDELESRWSRFLPDSEVSTLTARAGSAVEVSSDTALLVRRAVDAWRLSGGAFDPLVLGAVRDAGYDRSFDQLAAAGPATPTGAADLEVAGRTVRLARPTTPGPRPVARPANPRLAGCSDIELSGSTVRLPAGTGFDPGGIGKGLAADLVAGLAMAEGADGVCINLGGDVRVAGTSPRGGAWTIDVEHPWWSGPIARLGLADGAVATSTTLRRRWMADGHERHHLIDPFTGLPTTSDITLATVVAGEGWMAEAMAKSVLLRRATHAFDLVDGTGAEALTVDETGLVSVSAGFGAFLTGEVAPLPPTPAPTPEAA